MVDENGKSWEGRSRGVESINLRWDALIIDLLTFGLLQVLTGFEY